MTARIMQFPPFVVRLAEEDEAWLVICRGAWLAVWQPRRGLSERLLARKSKDAPATEQSKPQSRRAVDNGPF
jgi:hypothetical protein